MFFTLQNQPYFLTTSPYRHEISTVGSEYSIKQPRGDTASLECCHAHQRQSSQSLLICPRNPIIAAGKDSG